jgi:hypothetical protein
MKMADIHEQSINIKFCFKQGKVFKEALEIMKHVYGDQCVSHTHRYEWLKPFKGDRQSTHELCLGQPSTSCDDAHVVQVHEIVHSNCRFTVREIAKECNI